MKRRTLLACVMGMSLSGCQWLPLTDGHRGSLQGLNCPGGIPDFTQDECLLDDWIAYGLASQQSDAEWREAMLAQLEADAEEPRADQRLARATVLAWGDDAQRSQASSLLHADLGVAPVNLQPLLSYWLGELEQRREASARLAEARRARRASGQQSGALQAQVDTLNSQVEALTTKIEALTEIERNINARQHRE